MVVGALDANGIPPIVIGGPIEADSTRRTRHTSRNSIPPIVIGGPIEAGCQVPIAPMRRVHSADCYRRPH